MADAYRLPEDLMPGARTIALAWALVALAYTPPALLAAPTNAAPLSPPMMFLLVATGFTAWALATRPLIRLCARWPLGSGHANLEHLLLLAAAGFVALPMLALIGTAAGQLLLVLVERGRLALDPQRVAMAATINAFFSVPTYVAVIGVGQALVYVDRTRVRERMLARARLEALRAQIDPHFLFNALGAIAELAHRDPDRAETAIGRLADVLRSTLASDDDAVPLSTEIATVMDHVELHRMLLPGALDLRLSIAPAAWAAPVPALILQPLVENAVTHALSKLTAGGWLAIGAEVHGDRLVVEVSNARPTGDPAPTAGLGIGLRNVGERLDALYGDAAQVAVSADDAAFRVRIELPLAQPAATA